MKAMAKPCASAPRRDLVLQCAIKPGSSWLSRRPDSPAPRRAPSGADAVRSLQATCCLGSTGGTRIAMTRSTSHLRFLHALATRRYHNDHEPYAQSTDHDVLTRRHCGRGQSSSAWRRDCEPCKLLPALAGVVQTGIAGHRYRRQTVLVRVGAPSVGPSHSVGRKQRLTPLPFLRFCRWSRGMPHRPRHRLAAILSGSVVSQRFSAENEWNGLEISV